MEALLLFVLSLLLLAGIESSRPNHTTDDANTRTGIPAIRSDIVEEHGSVSSSRHKREIKFIDPITVKVLRTEKTGLWYFDMVKKKSAVIKTLNKTTRFSVDYHYQKQLLFYIHDDKIFREEVYGSELYSVSSSPIVVLGFDGPISLAVDWLHDKLYWLSDWHESIECSELDGSKRTTLIDNLNNLEASNNIALDPNEGLMFFVNRVSIFRANLDGTGLTQIALFGNGTCTLKSIAVEPHDKNLYYCGTCIVKGSWVAMLFRCDYEGKNVRELSLGPGEWSDIYSLIVFRNILYLASYISPTKPDTLWTTDLSQSPLNPVLQYSTSPDGAIWDIKVYHPEVQKIPEGIHYR